MAQDKSSNIRSKVEWAKKHVMDLDSAIRAFHDSNPYKIGTKRDPDTRKPIYYVSHSPDVPSSIPHMLGDAVGNMISVLDHLAYGIFLKGGSGGDGRNVQFPIARNATNTTEYKAACEGKVQGMPQQAIDALFATEAYKGGKGHQLWVLNELNNLSKHRELIVVGSRLRGVDIGGHLGRELSQMIGKAIPIVQAFYRSGSGLCPVKVGDELYSGLPDAKVDEKMEFRFDVAINEPQIIQAESLIETIHHLANLVDGIVTQFNPFL